ncbi:MAG: PIG-L family deacetylase [Oscillospiraceae bacterium]|nr:PIG-L family deacetylase [Oscillospiraceae bacterium]
MKYRFLRRTMSMLLALALIIPAGLAFSPAAPVEAYTGGRDRPTLEEAADRGMYETLLALGRLNKVGLVIITGAHPDDEPSNGLAAYVHDSPRYQVDMAYSVLTWGEGGINMIGSETFEGLGVVRAHEEESANLFDKKRSYPFVQFDAGYMPTFQTETVDPADGTKGRYDPNVILYQAARLIRLSKPDVIHNGHGLTGGHAQHQTTGIFTLLGVRAAKDPNYIVYDIHGNKLEPWEVSRVISGSGSAGSQGSMYFNRLDPYFLKSFVSYASSFGVAPTPWNNPTYTVITAVSDTLNSSQVSGYNGRSNDGNRNDTSVTNYGADAAFSAPGMAAAGWSNSPINTGTTLAGIDTSISRVNASLPQQHKDATQAHVDILKTALDNVVYKFPNGADPDRWNVDRPAGSPTLQEMGKVFIEEEMATAADVAAQIAAVEEDLVDAAAALSWLEDYAEGISDVPGNQAFTHFVKQVRRNFNDFVSRLYGIKNNVTLSDYDPSPGQKITVTSEIECFSGAFFEGNVEIEAVNNVIVSGVDDLEFVVTKAESTGSVKLPAQMLVDGLPVAVTVPDGSIVTPLTATPVKYTRQGRVYGADMDVTGYRYEYEITLAPDYREFTGPYNDAYDEPYNNAPASYPYGSSDYRNSDWVFAQTSAACAALPIVNRDVVVDNKTDQSDPFRKIRPLRGLVTFSIDGESYTVEQDVKVRLVPEFVVDIANESQSVMLKYSDDPQVNVCWVDVTNNTLEDAANVVVSATISPAGSGVTVTNQTVSIPAKTKLRVGLPVNIPAEYLGNPRVHVNVTYDGEVFDEGFLLINYTLDDSNTSNTFHQLEKQHLYRQSIQKLAIASISLPDDDIRIGFGQTGTDPDMFEVIKQMYDDPAKANQNCVILTAADIDKGGEWLKDNFDTIVIGARAYDTGNRTSLQLWNYSGAQYTQNGQKILDFVNRGGNLVVHDQNIQATGNMANIIPTGANGAKKNFTLSSGGGGNLNVTNCPIYIHESMVTSSVYTYPNVANLNLVEPTEPNVGTTIPTGWKLSDSPLWDGWYGQRAEWSITNVASCISAGYVPMLAGRDTVGQNIRPAIWGTSVGTNGGNWTYTAILWRNHMPVLAEGAYTIYANLLSLGYKGNAGWANSGIYSMAAASAPALGAAAFAPLSLDEIVEEEEIIDEEVLVDEEIPVVISDPIDEADPVDDIQEEEAPEVLYARGPSASIDGEISDYLDALVSEGYILVNGVKVTNFTVDKINGKIIINKNDPVLKSPDGFDVYLTTEFIVPRYNTAVVSGVLLKTIRASSLVDNGNGQSTVDFDIRSANGKGYTVYLSTNINGPFAPYSNVNYNAKGAHIKGLTNGVKYYVYIEYKEGSKVSTSAIVMLAPSK